MDRHFSFPLFSSRTAVYVRVAVSVLACMTLLFSNAPFWLKVVMVGVLVIAWWHDQHTACSCPPRLIYDHGQWLLIGDSGVAVRCYLRGECLVTPLLVVLPLQCSRHRRDRSLALWFDSMTAEDHRQLRVLLNQLPIAGGRG
jgi:hypothetical protein